MIESGRALTVAGGRAGARALDVLDRRPMRRRLLRLAVLVSFGLFGACATSSDPTTQTPAVTPSADASADRNTAKDTGGTVIEDDAGDEEDAAIKLDAGKDAKADRAVGDAGTPDTGNLDSGGTDAGTFDAADADVPDAADAADAADADVPDANDAAAAVDAADANDGAQVDAGCNDLVYGSAVMPLVATSGTAPTPTGGAIANGTYNLSGYNYYGATAPSYTLHSTVRINGNVIDRLITDATGIEKRQSGTFVTVGSTITMTWTCGGGTSDVGQYTAGNNKFAYYPVSVLEAIHTK